MSNFFQVECSINDNNSVIEVIQFDNNDLTIQQDVALYPVDIINIVDGELTNFLDAGSGINLSSSATGLLISVSGLNSTFISDFNEAVDDRIGDQLLSAGDNIQINYDDNANSLVISATGLQPSGNYALLSGANFTGNISAPSISGTTGYFTDMVYVNGVAVSTSGHTHIIPDVSNLQITLDNKLDLDDTIEGGFF